MKIDDIIRAREALGFHDIEVYVQVTPVIGSHKRLPAKIQKTIRQCLDIAEEALMIKEDG